MLNSKNIENINISLANNQETNIDREINKYHHLQFLKVKNIDLEEITDKLINDNEFIRIITNQSIQKENILYSKIADIEKKLVFNYNNITKEIQINSYENKRQIHIKINNGKKYYIDINLIKISDIRNSKKQQYTLSLELKYKKICNIHLNNFLCVFFCKPCCQHFFCKPCCQNKYEKEIDKYLDKI